jgi:hypothetical protein
LLLSLAIAFALGACAFWAVENVGRNTSPVPSASPPPGAPDMTITLSPPYLTRLAQTGASRSEAGSMVENLRVESAGDRLVLYGTLKAPASPEGVIEAQPFVQDGRLQFRLVEGKVGVLPLPGAVAHSLETQINEQLVNLQRLYPVTVTGARAGEGGLTLTAQATR